MARPQRFPCKVEFWTTEEQYRGLELQCADGLTDKSSIMRQALLWYQRQLGIAARTAQPNGQQHQAAGAEHA